MSFRKLKSLAIAAAICLSVASLFSAPAEARPQGGGGRAAGARMAGPRAFGGPRVFAPRMGPQRFVQPRIAPQRFVRPGFVGPQRFVRPGLVGPQRFIRPGVVGPRFAGPPRRHFWRGRAVWFGLPFLAAAPIGYLYDNCWQSVQTQWGWGWINICDPNWDYY